MLLPLAWVAGAVVVVPVAALIDSRRYERLEPRESFRVITGRELPAGVTATAYAHEMTDNLFHTTHYWILSGPPDALRSVTSGTGFVRSDEDAGWALPDMVTLFRLPPSRGDLLEGYEWKASRDRGYVIFEDGHTALYAH